MDRFWSNILVLRLDRVNETFWQFCVGRSKNDSWIQRFCNKQTAMLKLDVCSTYKHKFDFAGPGHNRARLGLSDATVHLRKDHGFCFERDPRRASHAAHDRRVAMGELLARSATCEPPSY